MVNKDSFVLAKNRCDQIFRSRREFAVTMGAAKNSGGHASLMTLSCLSLRYSCRSASKTDPHRRAMRASRPGAASSQLVPIGDQETGEIGMSSPSRFRGYLYLKV